jgi:hypothetical protein
MRFQSFFTSSSNTRAEEVEHLLQQKEINGALASLSYKCRLSAEIALDLTVKTPPQRPHGDLRRRDSETD